MAWEAVASYENIILSSLLNWRKEILFVPVVINPVNSFRILDEELACTYYRSF